MSLPANLPFFKMSGSGNDFVVVDGRIPGSQHVIEPAVETTLTQVGVQDPVVVPPRHARPDRGQDRARLRGGGAAVRRHTKVDGLRGTVAAARGLRVGLITNDQSTGLVDTALLGAHGFDYSLLLASGIQHEPYAFFENGRYVPIDPATPPDNRSTVLRKDGRYDITNNGTCEIVEAAKMPARCDVNYDSSQAGRILTAKGVQFIDDHLALNRRERRDRLDVLRPVVRVDDDPPLGVERVLEPPEEPCHLASVPSCPLAPHPNVPRCPRMSLHVPEARDWRKRSQGVLRRGAVLSAADVARLMWDARATNPFVEVRPRVGRSLAAQLRRPGQRQGAVGQWLIHLRAVVQRLLRFYGITRVNSSH